VSAALYRLARGVRLRRQAGGEAMLLVPEGILSLNDTAAAALELADGSRDFETIVAALSKTFDASQSILSQDVRELFEALVARGFVIP
jgi:coenzyme PQQ biosynthesis protein PqqD